MIIYFISLTIGCLVQQQEGDHSLLILQRIDDDGNCRIYISYFLLYQIWNKVNRKSSVKGVQEDIFIPGSLLIVPAIFSVKENLEFVE